MVASPQIPPLRQVWRPLTSVMVAEIKLLFMTELERQKTEQSGDDCELSDDDMDPEGFHICKVVLKSSETWSKMKFGSVFPQRYVQRGRYCLAACSLPVSGKQNISVQRTPLADIQSAASAGMPPSAPAGYE